MGKHRQTPRQRADQQAREAERLAAPVRMDGVGEDPAIKALLDPSFLTAKDTEALPIALAVQQILRGQNSILDNLGTMGDDLRRLTARMDAYDRKALEYEENQQKFIEDIENRAEKKMLPDGKREAFQARGAAQYQQEINVARLTAAQKRMEIERKLNAEPKVPVVSPGKMIQIKEAGGVRMAIEPVVLRYKHLKFILPPGRTTEIPLTVAKMYEQQMQMEAETLERRKTLSLDGGMTGRHEASKVRNQWNEIGRKYGTGSEAFPV